MANFRDFEPKYVTYEVFLNVKQVKYTLEYVYNHYCINKKLNQAEHMAQI